MSVVEALKPVAPARAEWAAPCLKPPEDGRVCGPQFGQPAGIAALRTAASRPEPEMLRTSQTTAFASQHELMTGSSALGI